MNVVWATGTRKRPKPYAKTARPCTDYGVVAGRTCSIKRSKKKVWFMFMKFVLEKGLLRILYKFFSVTTLIFAVLSFFNIENWFLRIFMQGSLSLMMLFMGMETISQEKEKYKLGYLHIGVAAFLFFVMIHTIVVGIKIGAF
ncbi:hypothetical protein ACHOLT_09435 [Desulfitobacterium sp. Sab5]|uniref:hypothetical protein n=1 Tax=Desulfitobacterium nosdiversum TaxID=3375356 RepID=UPI003CED2E64